MPSTHERFLLQSLERQRMVRFAGDALVGWSMSPLKRRPDTPSPEMWTSRDRPSETSTSRASAKNWRRGALDPPEIRGPAAIGKGPAAIGNAYFPSSKRHFLAAVGIFPRIFPESENEGGPLISLKNSGISRLGQLAGLKGGPTSVTRPLRIIKSSP